MKNLNNKKYSSAKTDIQKNLHPKSMVHILDLLKCPICKKICLMNINREKLLFTFECTNNHKNLNNNKLKKSKTELSDSLYSFPSNLSDLNISKEYNFQIKQVNNIDNNTSNITNETVQKLYITEKDILCQKHLNFKYISYCFECKKNLCSKCEEEHMNHNKINLNSIKPNDIEVNLFKKNIKKKEKNLFDLIENIQNWKQELDKGINILIKIMQNIFNLKEFIINNYDLKKNNQNYNYIQNYNNIKTLDFIFPELNDFSSKIDFKQKGYDIIDAINNINDKIEENKKKMKLVEEKENNDNIIEEKLKEKKTNVESDDTSQSIKNLNFKTNYTSDCYNNHFFNSIHSRKIIEPKKKKLGRNNNKTNELENQNISRTIEQNKELEKCINTGEFEEDNNTIVKDVELSHANDEKNYIINKTNTNNNDIKDIKEIKNDYDNFIIDKDRENNHILKNRIKNINMNNSIENEGQKSYNVNRNKYLNYGIDLKYESKDNDIIRSVEFLNDDRALIATLENISIYKIDEKNNQLIKEFDIKEYNYRINYATKLSNDDIIICSFNNIDIIKLSESDLGSYELIQKLEGKKDSYNINKIIEINNSKNNYLISCDKSNIIIFSKNSETNLYTEKSVINNKTEVKCIEKITSNIIISLEPEIQSLSFYTIEPLKKISSLSNIQSSFGRYAICYIEKYDYIFITGRFGLYLVSSKDFELKIFFKVKEWISSITYDYFSECLLCGTWSKDNLDENKNKNYNLIIFEIVKNENKDLISNIGENIDLREISRKNNGHEHDIVVMQTSKNGFIITGSNDGCIKLWK